ncbi:MAG: Methyltransferase type 11 [Microgenomates bacterium 39_6]|nr:MAG: Methyltransferase type 11 [Microgenomates bacterium 39_6]
MSTKYRFNPSPWGTHKIILSLLGKNQRVLDLGCASGYLGHHDEGKNIFYGLESDPRAAEQARKTGYYQRVVNKDLAALTKKDFVGQTFDIIIAADILEHLKNPQKTLAFLNKNFLKKKGKIIISLPNIAHLTIRLKLLTGKFPLQETGILDKTHLHFYTLKTAQKLIENSDLKIERVIFSSNRFGRLINHWPFLGPLLGFNLIFLCTKK